MNDEYINLSVKVFFILTILLLSPLLVSNAINYFDELLIQFSYIISYLFLYLILLKFCFNFFLELFLKKVDNLKIIYSIFNIKIKLLFVIILFLLYFYVYIKSGILSIKIIMIILFCFGLIDGIWTNNRIMIGKKYLMCGSELININSILTYKLSQKIKSGVSKRSRIEFILSNDKEISFNLKLKEAKDLIDILSKKGISKKE